MEACGSTWDRRWIEIHDTGLDRKNPNDFP